MQSHKVSNHLVVGLLVSMRNWLWAKNGCSFWASVGMVFGAILVGNIVGLERDLGS